jgi:2,4-dienoyl-CoA reductase-like NADH-dependent reductase (Old Yellow Enzyme family)/thioredoxin reductase
MTLFRNRFIFAPIKTGYSAGDGKVTDRHLRFYEPRAAHVGGVIPEPFYLDPALREIPTQMGIDDDDKLPGLSRLVATIHGRGAAAIAHLNHPGRMANPALPGNVFVSSTDRPCEAGGATPARMDAPALDAARELFVDAARRARQAGFDALELQLGHGYLLAQFLSPLVNDRDDEYGGDLEGRSRWPLSVVDAVREAVDMPLFVRVSGAEMAPGGIVLEETVALARSLKQRDVEAVHVSAGTVCSTPPWYFQHMFVPEGRTWDMAEKVRDEAGVTVVVVGRINDVDRAQKLRERFDGHYLAAGRALVADPDFVGKVLGEVAGPVRPCLACAEGCLGGVKGGRGLECLVNPLVGREELACAPAPVPRDLAVVGGGLAGMQAALTARERGHAVHLFEKDELGGQFNLAPLTPHKRSMGALVPYMVRSLDERGVHVESRAAGAAELRRFDGVVVATGSRPRVPDIPGLDEWRWADILADEELPSGKHVMIVGGGLIGVDVATALIPRDNRITIVKRTTDFGEDMEMIAKKLSLAMMTKSGTAFSDHTAIERIEGRTVHAKREGEPVVFEDVDLVVVTTGMQSVDALAGELAGEVPLWVVGDARQVGNAQDAITDAFLTTREI